MFVFLTCPPNDNCHLESVVPAYWSVFLCWVRKTYWEAVELTSWSWDGLSIRYEGVLNRHVEEGNLICIKQAELISTFWAITQIDTIHPCFLPFSSSLKYLHRMYMLATVPYSDASSKKRGVQNMYIKVNCVQILFFLYFFKFKDWNLIQMTFDSVQYIQNGNGLNVERSAITL